MPITYTTVDIDNDCVGNRWEIENENELAHLVGIVMKGEFAHAESILAGIDIAPMVYTPDLEDPIKQGVIDSLTVELDEHGKEKRETPKWHRDGLLFEIISWIVARMANSPDVLIRDPHIAATTQGLDGLIIELNAAKDQVIQTVVFEDKCMENARDAFRYQTLPAFKAHHANGRQLIASATTLLRQAVPAALITTVAISAIKIDVRKYRSALPILAGEDNQVGRARIFSRYGTLSNIERAGRIGCTFVPEGDMREWFEQFASKVIKSL
ncbi:MAG: hypothetical protein V4520_18530 [Bacteroidota bacterium]